MSEAKKVVCVFESLFGKATKFLLNNGFVKTGKVSTHSVNSNLIDQTIVTDVRAAGMEVLLCSHPCEILVLQNELSQILKHLNKFHITFRDADTVQKRRVVVTDTYFNGNEYHSQSDVRKCRYGDRGANTAFLTLVRTHEDKSQNKQQPMTSKLSFV